MIGPALRRPALGRPIRLFDKMEEPFDVLEGGREGWRRVTFARRSSEGGTAGSALPSLGDDEPELVP